MTKAKSNPQRKVQLLEMQLRGKDRLAVSLPSTHPASSKVSFKLSETAVSLPTAAQTDNHHYLRQDLTKTFVLASSILAIQGVLYLYLRSRGF